ncbi:MAG: DUF6519 domain-containing protein [Nannocystaceae bacterium]
MDGDITRNLFDPDKSYSSVRTQQGRLQVDADANEAVDIQLHDTRTARTDIIGRHGAPQDAPGMEVDDTGGGLRLRPGRYYVDGIRCELPGNSAEPPDWVAFEDQPHLPDAALPEVDGLYVVYLDVWERPITAVQDPSIREVALGGPDTSTRTQVVWQVKTLAVTTTDPTPSCATAFGEWDRLIAGPTGMLEVRTEEPDESTSPCLVPESAGFRGLQNHLYRFVIHEGNYAATAPTGDDGTDPTFKWSRDNGAVVGVWRDRPQADQLVVDRLGPGGAGGLGLGEWVELTDDRDELLERPGLFARIDGIDADRLTVVDATAPIAVPDDTQHAQVRRWDSPGTRDITLPAGDPDDAGDGWIRIEDGIQVRFGPGTYRSGDHWLVPARTALLPGSEDSQIDWPRDAGVPVALPPMGRDHHYARLAIARRSGGVWTVLDDCRNLFPPLTGLVQLEGRGGDGQHARSGRWLPAPIRVGVSRGTTPVVNSLVRFTIIEGGGAPVGALSSSQPDDAGNVPSTATVLEVATDSDGLAQVWWRMGMAPAAEVLGDDYQRQSAQRVEVTLLDPEGDPTSLSTRFVAQTLDNVTLTPAGGDGQLGIPGETLEIALRVRIADGTRPLAGARVRFSALSRMLDGTNLDEFRGGCIHASANVVSFTPWPGGSRMLEAVVQTDADGMAQVQQILGTERGLPVQRVQATLLDENGDPTSQTTLFTAHMAIASEVQWQVCKPAIQFLGTTSTVKAALDLHCFVLAALMQWAEQVTETLAGLDNGGGTTRPNVDVVFDGGLVRGRAGAADVVFDERRRPIDVNAFSVAGNGVLRSLDVDADVSLAELFGLELAPSAGGPAPERGVEVVVDVPVLDEDGRTVVGHTPVRLEGTTTVERGRVRWSPSDPARRYLERTLRGSNAVAMELSLGVSEGDTASTWRRRVRLTP